MTFKWMAAGEAQRLVSVFVCLSCLDQLRLCFFIECALTLDRDPLPKPGVS